MIDRTATEALIESAVALALELRDRGSDDWLDRATEGCEELRPLVQDAVERMEQLTGSWFDPSPRQDKAGETLVGRFRLGRRAGEGAMGVVYEAEDSHLARSVAVKLVRSGAMQGHQAKERFLREAEAMAAVEHPSIISIHDRGQTADGDPFIVMEWLDGVGLDAVIEHAGSIHDTARQQHARWVRDDLGVDARREGDYLRLVVGWVADVASGLREVHDAGILHRDIKPSNIIARRDGTPVLLDFGIALLDEDSTLTQEGHRMGTPAYMPPEVIVEGGHHGRASDTYSLCATLYHLLTLSAPYRGLPTEVMAAIATRDPVPAARLRRGLPRDLAAILDKGMHRRPTRRYRTATALEEDLRAFLCHRPVTARPIPHWQRHAARAWRSSTVRAMTAALALLAAVATGHMLRGRVVAAAEARGWEAVRQLPPGFSTVGLTNRPFLHSGDRAALTGLLDRAVESSADGARARLLRSSYRLDHGDPLGAARDFAALSAHSSSPYVDALDRAYARLSSEALGHGALQLADLPPPQTAFDHYLAGYHALRCGDEPGGYRLLGLAGADQFAHARELRLAVTPFGDLDSRAQVSRALGALEELVSLEHDLGTPSAATCQIAARMYGVMGRYDKALSRAEQGLWLAPRAYTLHINAAFAAFALQRFGIALSHLDVARELRPNYRKPLLILTWVLGEQGHFDEAVLAVQEANLTPAPDLECWRLQVLSTIEIYRALELKKRGEKKAFDTAVALAAKHVLEAQELGSVPFTPEFMILEGLYEGSDAMVFSGLAGLLQRDPQNVWRLRRFLDHLPEDLDVEQTQLVREVFDAQQRDLSSRALPE